MLGGATGPCFYLCRPQLLNAQQWMLSAVDNYLRSPNNNLLIDFLHYYQSALSVLTCLLKSRDFFLPLIGWFPRGQKLELSIFNPFRLCWSIPTFKIAWSMQPMSQTFQANNSTTTPVPTKRKQNKRAAAAVAAANVADKVGLWSVYQCDTRLLLTWF